jgi:hypothetical protein
MHLSEVQRTVSPDQPSALCTSDLGVEIRCRASIAPRALLLLFEDARAIADRLRERVSSNWSRRSSIAFKRQKCQMQMLLAKV